MCQEVNFYVLILYINVLKKKIFGAGLDVTDPEPLSKTINYLN